MAVDAGSVRSEVRIALDRLKQDIAKVEVEFDKLGKDIDSSTGETSKKAQKNFKDINLAGVAAFAGVSLALKSAIGTFAQFEQSLANVRAVTGATREEFAVLEQAARDAGETTRFTASEAADALFFLASAGLDATQSIEALDGVLQLAGATGSDLAFTAESVTATLSQFGLQAGESARVANVFAAANQNSQATLEKLSSALRQAGPIAAGLNVSLEETVGALQLLFNAGFRGEQAGTALRNALGQLANEASPTVERIKELGIAFEEIDPTANGLIGTIGRLEQASLSTGQIIEIFGQEAGPQLATLLNQGADALQDYTDAVTGTNAAAESYAIQNDTLQGSLDILRSTAEETAISFTKEFAPILRSVVDTTRDFLAVINGLPGPVKIFLGILIGAVPVITGVTTAVSLLGGALAVLTGPVGLVVAGITALTAGTVALGTALNRANVKRLEDSFGELSEEIGVSSKLIDTISNQLQGLASTGFGNVNDNVEKIARNLGVTQEQVIAIGLASDDITDSYKEQLQTLQDQLDARKEEQQALIEQQQLQNQLDGLASGRLEFVEGEFRLKKDINELTDEEVRQQQQLDQLAQARENRFKSLRQSVKDILNSEKERIEESKTERDLIQEQLEILDSQNARWVEGTRLENERIEAVEILRQRLADLNREELQAIIERRQEEDEAERERLNRLERQLQQGREAVDKRNGFEEQYTRKVLEQSGDRLQIIRNEYEEALDIADELGADRAEIDAFYQQEIADEEARILEQRKEKYFGYYDEITDAAFSLFQAIVDLQNQERENAIEEIDRQQSARERAIDDSIADIRRRVEQGKISEEQATVLIKEKEEEKKQAVEQAEREKTQIRYEAELAQWRITLSQAIAEGARAIISGFLTPPFIPAGLIAGALATGLAGAEIATVGKSKPQPPSFQTGGIVKASPGGTLARVAENGNDELLFNAGASGRPLLNQFADVIAERLGAAGQGGVINLIIDIDGKRVAQNSAQYYNNGTVRINI